MEQRGALEARFGFQFGGLRIHRADPAAEAWGARALTSGAHIWFAPGHGPEDGSLLAHEAAHAVQQASGETAGLRGAGGDESRRSRLEAHARRHESSTEPGSARSARPLRPLPVAVGGAHAVQFDFEDDVLAELHRLPPTEPASLSEAERRSRARVIHGRRARLRVLFGGVSPAEARAVHGRLRRRRRGDPLSERFYDILATATRDELLRILEARMTAPETETAPEPETAAEPDEGADSPSEAASEGEAADAGQEAARRCGPDITDPLTAVLASVRTQYRSWTASQRRDACSEVVNPMTAAMAWDIKELFNAGWTRLSPYHPPCGMPDDPDSPNEDSDTCSKTVEVFGRCYLAGTVNYALFGEICRLCDFSESTMVSLIHLYKLASTLYTDSPGPPIEWARSAYRGFPASTPTSNRPRCPTDCPIEYQGVPFDFVWEPHKPR